MRCAAVTGSWLFESWMESQMAPMSSTRSATLRRRMSSMRIFMRPSSDAVHEPEHALVHHAHHVVFGTAKALHALLERGERRSGRRLHRQHQVEVARDHLLRDVVHARTA